MAYGISGIPEGAGLTTGKSKGLNIYKKRFENFAHSVAAGINNVPNMLSTGTLRPEGSSGTAAAKT